jgi:membrane protein DedA with SNARE-associated domain
MNGIDAVFAAGVSAGPWLMLGALALATLASEDLACIAAGLLVAEGQMGFAAATAACFVGIFAGDLGLVLAGRWAGGPLVRRWVDPGVRWRAEGWLRRQGAAVVFTSRFLPGTRLPTFLAIGGLRLPLRRFVGWFALACAVWTPLLVGTAWLAGRTAERWLAAWAGAVPVLLAGAVGAWLLARLAVGMATWRGRREWLGRWRRLVRWEFWPRWAIYPPVVVYCLVEAVRARSLTWFTNVNPGIEAGGGLVGESKSAILHGLAGAGDRVARWTRVPPGPEEERRAAVAAAALGWPVVLKPDVGERGDGVIVARDDATVRAKLRSDRRTLIAQAYVPGVEFGIFYARRPSEPKGRIIAVTEKRIPAVTGDGRRTLEELILGDDRAVCLAPVFLRAWARRLDEVPAAGVRLELTELGTHCRGAVFLDGARHVTPALAAAVEAVSRTFDGFHFGRYDVRTSSAEALRRGEFVVIELNGVSSEATSLYDPAHSVWQGWRVLLEQWRLAAAIARDHRKAGVRPLGVAATWRLVARRPAPGAV